MTKHCRACGAVKNVEAFYRQPFGDGYRSICRACHSTETVRSRYKRAIASCPTTISRFLSRVQLTECCWIWTGAKTSDGYGLIRVTPHRVPRYAHRFSYEAYVGPIPEGLTLDHLCRNRACVNPSHLEAVTNAENIRRGADARRKAAAA